MKVAGDGHYGTASNYLYCERQGIQAHLAPVSAHTREQGKFPISSFVFDAQAKSFLCPAGQKLILHQHKPDQQLDIYRIEKAQTCARCELRSQCTTAKAGRSIARSWQAEQIEQARQQANSPAARYSRKRRKHVMEGNFADAANNHGLKRARWRRLWRQQVQTWMIALVQNLRILIANSYSLPKKAVNGLKVLSGSGFCGSITPNRLDFQVFACRRVCNAPERLLLRLLNFTLSRWLESGFIRLHSVFKKNTSWATRRSGGSHFSVFSRLHGHTSEPSDVGCSF